MWFACNEKCGFGKNSPPMVVLGPAKAAWDAINLEKNEGTIRYREFEACGAANWRPPA